MSLKIFLLCLALICFAMYFLGFFPTVIIALIGFFAGYFPKSKSKSKGC